MEIEYRKAEMKDLDEISAFTDFWMCGYGVTDSIPGTGNNYFVSAGQHESYMTKHNVQLALHHGKIVGWAVSTKKGVLIHLLIAGTFRKQGIGSKLLEQCKPSIIRSKSDQSTGNPSAFYEAKGYLKKQGIKVGRKNNIEIFYLPGHESEANKAIEKDQRRKQKKKTEYKKRSNRKQRRTIELLIKEW